MSGKSCLVGGLAIAAIAVTAGLALAIFAFNTWGWSPDVSPHLRPFRTEKGGFSALSPDGKKFADIAGEHTYPKTPGTDRYGDAYTLTLSIVQIDNWQRRDIAVYHEDINRVYFTPDDQSLVVVGDNGIEWKSLPGGAVTRKLSANIGCCRVAI